jgi:hypothetical protein
MKKPNRPTASQRVAGSVEKARAEVAIARTAVQTAKHGSTAAKRKRKLARRHIVARKSCSNRRRKKLAEAKRSLAAAEKTSCAVQSVQ